VADMAVDASAIIAVIANEPQMHKIVEDRHRAEYLCVRCLLVRCAMKYNTPLLSPDPSLARVARARVVEVIEVKT
jgi:predicted nucleic acid-binding protein